MTGHVAQNCIHIPLPLAILEICVGPPPPPAPDLPEVEFPTPGNDLPGQDLPDTEARPDTGAEVESDAEAMTREDICTEGCWECAAVNNGRPEWQRYRRDPTARVSDNTRIARDYQEFVTGLPHDYPNRQSLEWIFASDVPWDGIDAPTCTLLEAKHGYDEGFLVDDWGAVALFQRDGQEVPEFLKKWLRTRLCVKLPFWLHTSRKLVSNGSSVTNAR